MSVMLFCPFHEINTTKIFSIEGIMEIVRGTNKFKNKIERDSEQKQGEETKKSVIKTIKGFDTQHTVWLNVKTYYMWRWSCALSILRK